MRKLFPLFIWCALLPLLAQNQVTGSLIANREVISKGSPFLLGIHLKMTDHWHTYWENPGFAGLPPSWKLNEVPGLTIEALQFPWPSRWQDNEGFVTYGYDDEVVIYASAVYNGDASEIILEGDIDWVACKSSCIPGHAKGHLKLAVGSEKAGNEKLFKHALGTTPRPFTDDSPFTFDAITSFAEERWTSTVTVRPKEGVVLADTDPITLFPLGTRDMADLQSLTITQEDGAYKLVLDYEAYEANVPDDFTLSAAMKFQTNEQSHYVRMNLSQPTAAAAIAAPTETSPESAASEASTSSSIAYWLLLAFLGGLILNLMPCVLPVLSLKVFSLLKEVGQNTGQRITYGWVYTLGIMVCFNILSGFFIAAQLTGNKLGVGFQFQSPTFVIAISVLIFVMALSFLGVFHIGQPSSNKLHTLSMRSGYQGAFFNGALMTILSTPCTAPMLGAAYGWALSQSPQVILLTFNVIAFGLAFPYLALCYAPGLLKFLPKPGAWMENFKISMGFLMLATLVWLISILSDLTGSSGVTGLLVFLLAVGGACFIYGRSWHSDRRRAGAVSMAVLLALGGYLGFSSLFDIRHPQAERDKHLDELRIKFLSESGSASNLAALLEGQVTTADEIMWVPYNANNLDYFRKQDRLIFVDFTAAWCTTCKINERLTIDTQQTRELFANNKMVVMRADYTDKSDDLTVELKKFNRAGVPMYLVYPGQSEPILMPEVITKDMVADTVEEARQLLQQRASLTE